MRVGFIVTLRGMRVRRGVCLSQARLGRTPRVWMESERTWAASWPPPSLISGLGCEGVKHTRPHTFRRRNTCVGTVTSLGLTEDQETRIMTADTVGGWAGFCVNCFKSNNSLNPAQGRGYHHPSMGPSEGHPGHRAGERWPLTRSPSSGLEGRTLDQSRRHRSAPPLALPEPHPRAQRRRLSFTPPKRR